MDADELKESMAMAFALVGVALDYIANDAACEKIINDYAKACGKLYRALLAEGLSESTATWVMGSLTGALGKKG